MITALAVALSFVPESTYASTDNAPQLPKALQSSAQQKISTILLREIDRARRGVNRAQRDGTLDVVIDAKDRALVEIRCDVTEAILVKLRDVRAVTVTSLPAYRSILAWIPLTRLEDLASDHAVYSVQPAPHSITYQQKERRQ